MFNTKQYGMVHILMTIMYTLNVLSRYGNNPEPRHIEFAERLFRYVKYSRYDRLKFKTHDGPTDIRTMTKILQLRFQCDADLSGNPDTKHSQTSYLGYLADSLICWCSTNQGSISTCKTKYKMSPSSVRSEGGEAAEGYCLNSVSYRVDEAVKYNVLNSD